MKLLIITLALIVSLSAMGQPTPAPKVFFNESDKKMWQTLSESQVYFARIQTASVSGKDPLRAWESGVFTALEKALNTAQATYIAYHVGQATQDQAKSAIDAVTVKELQLQNMRSIR